MADVNGMFMRDHAFTLTKLGTAKEEMDKLDEALQCYTMAMQIHFMNNHTLFNQICFCRYTAKSCACIR